ncbi:MAG TPA: DUF3035 domain-containing protein [Alphaproteobacteria bacterium]
MPDMKRLVSYASLVTVLALSACGGDNDVKEKLGLKASPPDEFSVVTRAPLSVPPDYTLRPPRPGADRPMELSVREQAKKTVFGTEDVKGIQREEPEAPTGANSAILGKLGASPSNSSVRDSLDSEMVELDKSEQPAAEKLLFWKDKEPRGKTIDPVEEQKKLEASGVSEKKMPDSKKSSSVEKRNEDILESE